VVALAKTFVLDAVVVQGASMEPTLRPGDYVLMEKITPHLGLLRPGQIVVLAAETPSALIVKRIVALGGDQVQMRAGEVLVNGEPGPAEDRTTPDYYDWGPTVVPEGQLFVLGDNRPRSDDSKDFGPVPAANVKGHVIAGPWHWESVVHAAEPPQ